MPKPKELPVEIDALAALRETVRQKRDQLAADEAALAAAHLKHLETGSEADGTAWQAARWRVDEDRGELLPLEARLAAMEAAALDAARRPFLDGADQKTEQFTGAVPGGVREAIGVLRERLVYARDLHQAIGQDLRSGAHPRADEVSGEDLRELPLSVIGMLREVFPSHVKAERAMALGSLDRLAARLQRLVNGKGD